MIKKRFTTEQRVFLNKVIKSKILDKFDKKKVWFDFSESFDIKYLKDKEHIWTGVKPIGWVITDKILSFLADGEYDKYQGMALNSVGTYYKNRKEIDKMNGL